MRWREPTTTGSPISARRRRDRLFAAAIVPLQNMDFAVEELQRVARIPCVRARLHSGRCSSKAAISTIRSYDPLWAELERARDHGAAVHATPGLWNPEWTSHGPFFEKIKDRLAQPPIMAGGGGRCRRRRQAARPGTSLFTGATPLGHPLAPILAYWLDNHLFVASTPDRLHRSWSAIPP